MELADSFTDDDNNVPIVVATRATSKISLPFRSTRNRQQFLLGLCCPVVSVLCCVLWTVSLNYLNQHFLCYELELEIICKIKAHLMRFWILFWYYFLWILCSVQANRLNMSITKIKYLWKILHTIMFDINPIKAVIKSGEKYNIWICKMKTKPLFWLILIDHLIYCLMSRPSLLCVGNNLKSTYNGRAYLLFLIILNIQLKYCKE